MVGLNVYNDQNEKLGDINEILLDKSGKVDGVVIGVGGFLGMGEHDIKVDMAKLKFVNQPVKTSSTTIAPVTRPGRDRPTMVTIGSSELRSTCRDRTSRSGRPLARAMRM